MSLFEALFKYPFETFAEGRLVFLTRIRGEVLLLILTAFAAVAWLLYRQVRDRVSRRSRRWLLGLRIGVLVVLFFLLATPAIRIKAAPDEDRKVFTAVLVDTSRSMLIEDAKAGREATSRFGAAMELLSGRGGEDGLIGRISEHAKVLVYGFDQAASRAADPRRLKAEGVFTNIFRSVRDVESELRGLPLAAVVMVTDGCRNTGGSCQDAAGLLRNRGVPLYAVGLGNPNPPKDYEVVRVFAPRKIWRNTEVDAYVTLRHTDFREPFEVQVRRGDEVLATRKITPDGEADLRRVRLTFTPDHTEGTATYRVVIPPSADEKVTDNNFRDMVLEVLDDRLPVLYVEGSPRTEYRFLRRALFRDPDFRLVGLLRLAADRYYIQGANPSELYLKNGFPTTPEQLFAFKAVILGDIEASYFTPGQLALLEEFVRDRGGGLLMLGGVNSFGLGKYAGTPVGRMLPVVISERDGAYSDQEYTARATPEGLEHTVMRIDQDGDANQRLWEQAPPLIGVTPVGGVKKAASALLVQRPEDGGRVVLAAQNYGQGRVGAFTSGGSWYWQVSRPAGDEFHEKFWKQMIRWLVVGARERLTVRTDADVYARQDSVIIRATVRRKDLRPVNDAAVIATIVNDEGNRDEVPMYWTMSEDGVYQCRTKATIVGECRVSVRVDGWDIPPAETSFEVAEPLVEFSNAGLKEDVLRTMAGITGGGYYDYAGASAIPERIEEAVKKAPTLARRPVDRELWDMPALFLLCLAVVAVEWIVRRKSGLA